MAELPTFLTDQTEDEIRQRLLDALPEDLDRSEGSFLWDAVAPLAVELAQAAIWAQQVLDRGFAQTTFGLYLELRAQEHGVLRRAAVAATGVVRFTGTQGTVIAAGTEVSTPSTEAVPAEIFTTDTAATIPAGGTIDVAVTALEGGAAGNVAAGAIQLMVEPIDGVTGVTNVDPTSGGLDAESDEDLLDRLLTKVRNPSAGGNKADYLNWALEVAGVGGAAVVPVRAGAGTVSVAIVDLDKRAAGQALVDDVQDYIAPPWDTTVEAESLTRGGSGTSVDTSLSDDVGDSVKMVYDAGGAGTLTDADADARLSRPGIHQARLKAKVDSAAGATDLLEVGVWNVDAAAWAQTTAAGGTDARTVFQANDLATAFGEIAQQFYWNGSDDLELRVTRLQTDTATIVWIDQARYRSTFSMDTGDGKAPIGAAVTVEPATEVAIDVSATLTILPGYDAPTVRAAAEDAIVLYLEDIALSDDNDVRYARIASAILDTSGVDDYSNLLVNGATGNVVIADQEVALKGTVTFS